MKNLLSAIVATLLVITYSPSFTKIGAQEPPPPAKDYFPNTWEEFTFPKGQFKIRFPQKPQEAMVNQDDLEIHAISHKGLMNYRVSFVDFKVRIDQPDKVKGLLQGVKSAALKAIGDKTFDIKADREVLVDRYSGVFVHLEVQGREVVRMQWIAAGSHLYSISAESRKGSPQELEGADDYEKVAMGFINSFHVIG